MDLVKDFLDTIVLLGALQGFIVSALLFRIKKKTNKYLGFIILLLSLACLYIFLMESQVFTGSTFWLVVEVVVPMIIIMPVGPLIYFYVKASINPGNILSKKDKIHFYPTVLDLVPSLVAIYYIIGLFFGLIDFQKQSDWGNFIDDYNRYVDIPRWISVSAYSWASWRLISHQNEQKGIANVRWLKQMIIGFSVFQLIWLSHLIPYLMPSLIDSLLNAVSWYPIYIPLAIMIYWLGINGYFIRRAEIKNDKKPIPLSLEEINFCIQSLENAVAKERLYLNPTLSLNDVVTFTGINQKIISAVLNQHLGKSFNIFINEYRVNEVKRRLLDPNYNHLTITGIAFESGFNSQATFQRTFRQITGQSPKEYKLLFLEKS